VISLTDKQLFDFEYSIDILTKSEGTIGVAFRIEDQFNYYAFAINKKQGTKSIIKVLNGKPSVLNTITDGGILLNEWLHVVVTTKANLMTVKTWDAVTKLNEKVLQAYDNNFISGTIGVFANNVDAMFFDNLNVEPINCWSAWVPKKDVIIKPVYSNIYSEDLEGSFLEKYTIRDPEKVADGPSKWDFRIIGRNAGIVQSSMVYDSSAAKLPSFILLKDSEIKHGSIRVIFTPEKENGAISIIFKYFKDVSADLEKYYRLTFTHSTKEGESEIALLRFTNGGNKVIQSITAPLRQVNNLQGYAPGLKHDVLINIFNDEIKASISVNNSKYEEFLKAKDKDISEGQVGLGTYKTTAVFSAFDITPPQPTLTEAERTTIMTTNNQDIYFPVLPGLNQPSEDDKNANKEAGGADIELYKMIGQNGSIKQQQCNKPSIDDRINYCTSTRTTPEARVRCNREFCTTCCDDTVTKEYPEKRRQCNKECESAPIAKIRNDDYMTTCISPGSGENNIYESCDGQTTSDIYMKQECKFDMCQLCCTTMDIIKSKIYDFENVKDCLKECDKGKILKI
jgi:hypothetical protein